MKGILYFLTGATVGSVVTYFVTKSHWQKKTDEQINLIREYYNEKEKPESEENVSTPVKEVKKEKEPLTTMYNAIVKDYESDNKKSINIYPYTISEEEYAEDTDHEKINTWFYYEPNEILIDHKGNEVVSDQIARTVGADFAEGFTGENDVLYIRNDEIMCDYEIVIEDEEYTPQTIQG